MSKRNVRVEHFLYGMFNGRIMLQKTAGVNQMASDKDQAFLRSLAPDFNGRYVWLKATQTIALPYIETAEDDFGRKWVKNHTLLINIHDYLQLTKPFDQLGRLHIKGIHDPKTLENLEPFEVAVNG